jgi:hypothetical protein
MPEVTVKYKNNKSLKALQDLAKAYNMEIEKPVEKGKETKKPPIRFSARPDANALSGIWKDTPMTLEDLRKKAWGDRL